MRPWDLFAPVHRLWWWFLGAPLLLVLHWLTGALAAFPLVLAVGPFGVAVILVTLALRLALVPLAIYQLRAGRRARVEAARIEALLGKQMARLRKKHAGNPLALNQELAALYQEHGIHPLSASASVIRGALLTGIIQAPVVAALYYAIRSFAGTASLPVLHFLWLTNVALPDSWFILPVIAAASSYLLGRATSRQAAASSDPAAARLQRQTRFLGPAAIAVSAHFAPAALAVYWITGNCAQILQQHFLAGRFLN